MRAPRPIWLAAASSLTLLAGCGGEEPLSRAEYVKQADAICKDYTARLDGLEAPKDVKDVERLAEQTRPLVEAELGKLRGLEAPKDIAGDANDAYDLLEQQLPKIDQLVAAARANDEKRINAIAVSAGKLDDAATAKATGIGLKVCGAPRKT